MSSRLNVSTIPLESPPSPPQNEALLSRIAALERPPATKGAAKRFVPAAAPKVSAAFLEVLKRPSSHTAYEAAVELLQGGKPPPRNARRRILPSWKPRVSGGCGVLGGSRFA